LLLSAVAEMPVFGATSVLDKVGGDIAASGRIFLLTRYKLMLTGYTLYALQQLLSLLAVAVIRHNSAKNFQNVCFIVPLPG
jgi:hypothetical protein